MGTAAEWNELALELRKAPGGNPWKSPKVGAFFKLAEADGIVMLRSFAFGLGDDAIRDLIRDLLTLKLAELVESSDAKTYFARAIRNHTISHKRKHGTRVVEAPTGDEPRGTERNPSSDRAFSHDALAVLGMLSPKQRQIVIAVGNGEDRTVVARELKTSRANVDQIVSRARKLFRKRSEG